MYSPEQKELSDNVLWKVELGHCLSALWCYSVTDDWLHLFVWEKTSFTHSLSTGQNCVIPTSWFIFMSGRHVNWNSFFWTPNSIDFVLMWTAICSWGLLLVWVQLSNSVDAYSFQFLLWMPKWVFVFISWLDKPRNKCSRAPWHRRLLHNRNKHCQGFWIDVSFKSNLNTGW